MNVPFRKFITTLIVVIFFFSFVLLVLGVAISIHAPQLVIRVLERIEQKETVKPLTIRGIGVLGDSQSDEYRADDARGLTYAQTTLNWVEQLQKYRNLPFGAWGTWGEPRRTGYEYNWSRTGATITDLFDNGSVAGLTQQVKNGEVNVVFLTVGANDFSPYLSDGYEAIYSGSLSDIDVRQKRSRIVSDLRTITQVLQESGNVRIVLFLIPDWGNHLGIRVAFPLPEPRQRVTQAIIDTNTDLKTMAEEEGVTTIDPNIFYQQLFSSSLSEVTVGDTTLNAILPSDDPRSVFLDDGTHTGTILNGLFANYVITSMNRDLGTAIRPFTTQEILNAAGL